MKKAFQINRFELIKMNDMEEMLNEISMKDFEKQKIKF